MKIKLNYDFDCEIDVIHFSPFERYIEFYAYLNIDGQKVEFTEEMYGLVYDEVYDKQMEIYQGNWYDRQVEIYLAGKV